MDTINIRDIQHFSYCPHRWGLINIDKVWTENIFVIKANLMHESVHNSEKILYAKNKRTYNAVSIYNDELEIFGVTDSLIVENNKYSLLEYKPSKPKNSEFNVDDALQVFAQKVCVDYIFNTNCKAYLYYKNEKYKVMLPFDTEYDFYYNLLNEKLSLMRKYLSENKIPPITKGQKCSGCSLKDLCMPMKKSTLNVKKRLYSGLEENNA